MNRSEVSRKKKDTTPKGNAFIGPGRLPGQDFCLTMSRKTCTRPTRADGTTNPLVARQHYVLDDLRSGTKLGVGV